MGLISRVSSRTYSIIFFKKNMQCNKSAGDFPKVQKQDNDTQVTLQETESNSDFHSCTSSTSNQKLLNNLKNHEITQPHTQQQSTYPKFSSSVSTPSLTQIYTNKTSDNNNGLQVSHSNSNS